VRAQIRHVTEYQYSETASDSFNELRLKPAQTDNQSLLGFKLTLQPPAPTTERTDYYGTKVYSFHLAGRHSALRIETSATVVTHRKPLPQPVPALSLKLARDQWVEYLAPSQQIPAGDWAARLEYPALNDSTDLLEYLMGLNARIKTRFEYRSGATRIGTPLEEFLRLGAGVCQDYAHLMLAVCREAGIPARYVSGYVYAGADFIGAEATHAWVECYLPGSGWVGFDPTNDVLAGESHIRIGHGRDYADVPPLRGLRRGGGVEHLEVAVTVHAQEQ
jgi:transglutaminase-like putative cysteine protease